MYSDTTSKNEKPDRARGGRSTLVLVQYIELQRAACRLSSWTMKTAEQSKSISTHTLWFICQEILKK